VSKMNNLSWKHIVPIHEEIRKIIEEFKIKINE
jgi:hypothetical protein